jgi:hypothetical protein
MLYLYFSYNIRKKKKKKKKFKVGSQIGGISGTYLSWSKFSQQK